MRFDTKLFRLLFLFTLSSILILSLILVSFFSSQYARAMEDNLRFLNMLLHTQTSQVIEYFGHSASDMTNSRDLENLLGEDPVSRFFAEKSFHAYSESMKASYPYLQEIRVQKGDAILFSSLARPLSVDPWKDVSEEGGTLYRSLRYETQFEGTYLIYILAALDFLKEFNLLHSLPTDQIVYIIAGRWAVSFDEDLASRLHTVEFPSQEEVRVQGKDYRYFTEQVQSIAQIAVSRSTLYRNIMRVAFSLLLFLLISGGILFFLIRRISRSLTSPIRLLSQQASSVQTGSLPEFYYEGEMVDEVRSLTDSYNYMTREMREFTQTLEEEVRNRTRVIEEQKEELEKISITDQLTGLYNRRNFDERIERDFSLAIRNDLYIGLGIIDVDNFKQVNDTHGHLFGDSILQGISGTLSSVFRRRTEGLFRYGGDEFMILFLDRKDSRNDFIDLAESLRAQVEKQEYTIEEGMKDVGVTVSIGLFFSRVDKDARYQDIINAADSILYRVKELGRNRVMMAEQLSKHSSLET